MSDIRHSCKCLGRNFTTNEWHEYLYQHPDAHSGPVFQFKGYEYNINDVCLNPHIPVKIEHGGCKVSIMTDEFFERNDFDKNILYWSEGGAICNKDRIDGYYIIAISLFNPPTGPSANVHCVHELQQLLRLGGYAELANNVEIMTNND